MQNTLRNLSQSELEARYIDNLKRAMDIRFEIHKGAKQVRVHLLRKIRLENARIKTLLNMVTTKEESDGE